MSGLSLVRTSVLLSTGSMSYRDDTEALRARIDVLENELAEAKARIAELSGERAPVPQDGAKENAKSFWVAAPTTLLLERELDLEPTPEIIDRLTTLFRRELPAGTMTPSDRAFGFRFGTLDASLTPIGGGRARLRLFVDHRGVAMLPSTLALVMAFLAVPVIGPTMGPLAVLAITPIVWTLGFLFLRRFIGGRLNGYRMRFAKLFEAAAAIANQPPVRVAIPYETARVEMEDEAGEDADEEANERARRA